RFGTKFSNEDKIAGICEQPVSRRHRERIWPYRFEARWESGRMQALDVGIEQRNYFSVSFASSSDYDIHNSVPFRLTGNMAQYSHLVIPPGTNREQKSLLLLALPRHHEATPSCLLRGRSGRQMLNASSLRL